MRRLLVRAALVFTATAILSPGQAQVPPGAVAPAQQLAAYPAYPYPFPAPTPEDAYRGGLINRWELEQFAGPLPQALQGPNVDGTRGGDGGGGGRD
jgi:hypothetical protein